MVTEDASMRHRVHGTAGQGVCLQGKARASSAAASGEPAAAAISAPVRAQAVGTAATPRKGSARWLPWLWWGLRTYALFCVVSLALLAWPWFQRQLLFMHNGTFSVRPQPVCAPRRDRRSWVMISGSVSYRLGQLWIVPCTENP